MLSRGVDPARADTGWDVLRADRIPTAVTQSFRQNRSTAVVLDHEL